MPGLGVFQGRAARLHSLDDGFLELAVDLVEGLALGNERWMLVGIFLRHLAHADLRGAQRREGGGDIGVGADLGDVTEGAPFLLIAGDDQHQNLVLVDLLAGLLAILDEHRAFRGEGIGILGDREQLLVLDEVVLLFEEAADLIFEGLDLDAGLLDERVGHHQAAIFAILLDCLTEEPGDLAGEVAIGMREGDVDYQRLALWSDAALLGEDFLLRERPGEDIAGLIGLEDLLAFVGGEALGDALDDVGAAHLLDGREEVVVRDDLKVIFGRRGASIDGRCQTEDAQAARGLVFRNSVVGLEQREGEEN